MLRPDKDSRDLKVVSELLQSGLEIRVFRESFKSCQDLSLEVFEGILDSLLLISVLFTSLWVELEFVERCGPFEGESSHVWVDTEVLQQRDVLLVAILFCDLSTDFLAWASCQYYFVLVEIDHLSGSKSTMRNHNVFGS